MVLGGTADIGGFGNAKANTITGNAGSNLIEGGDGNDTLQGMNGNDTLVGGSLSLSGGLPDLNGTLTAGAGRDSMVGGAGNDTYYVGHTTDVIVEAAGGGTDTVVSWLDYTLSLNLETLVLAGSAVGGAGKKGTGNATNNTLWGNDLGDSLNGAAGNDTIHGGTGADTIVGGTGADLLYGGGGSDQFSYNATSESASATSHDTIADFGAADLINLSAFDANTALTGKQTFTSLVNTAFTTHTFTAPGQLVFDPATHTLYGNTNTSYTAAEIVIVLTGVNSLTLAGDHTIHWAS
jgi:Ca2+-binding RTX toxin-like protein